MKPELWSPVIVALIGIIASITTYFLGTRQKIAAEREKARLDAENARISAEAAEATADANRDKVILESGVANLKTMQEGAAAYTTLLKELRELNDKFLEQAAQFTQFKLANIQEIGEIKLQHTRELSEVRENATKEHSALRERITHLEGQVASLQREIEVKDRALLDCAEVRIAKERLELQLKELTAENELYRQGNNAFFTLIKAAKEANTDGSAINAAEEAINRIMEKTGMVKASPLPA